MMDVEEQRLPPSELTAEPRARLMARFQEVRHRTLALCDPLEPEDCVVQAMPDVSPPKWHLAHTTWFFETFVLRPYVSGYQAFCEPYTALFNSYYQSLKETIPPRAERGLLSRPTLKEVLRYRATINQRMEELIHRAPQDAWAAIATRVELGLHHEQQHQELLLMDVKYNFWRNPLRPAYIQKDRAPPHRYGSRPFPNRGYWIEQSGDFYAIGHKEAGFAFDNEMPEHRVHLEDFGLATRCVTNREFLEFIEDGGYESPDHWLADGWTTVQEQRWGAPLYWEKHEDTWQQFTLGGMKALEPEEPVSHVSYYEADAYARWAQKRLPTEFEWEIIAQKVPVTGNTLESQALEPRAAAPSGRGPAQMFGDVWEWTSSPYAPYPGYQAQPGAIGEYNGKFMCNQLVQKGGSCLTSKSHLRATYRNYFYPHQRWNCQGFRLAYSPNSPR